MGDIKKGVSKELTERVFNRLFEKGYLDDEKFARFWVENRNVRKGSSMRKLQMELRGKGVDSVIIEQVLANTERADSDELQKIIAKKASRYDDIQKLTAYLVRQGFRYDDVKEALARSDDE
jgi:regulatory protein